MTSPIIRTRHAPAGRGALPFAGLPSCTRPAARAPLGESGIGRGYHARVADRRSPLLGSLTVVLAACLFATLGVLSRTTYDLGLTPYAFVTWRSGVAAIGMALVVAWTLSRGGRVVGWRSLSPRDRVALGVAALAGASLDVTMFLAFARVPVAIVLLCFYLFPAIVAAASALLGWERMDRTRALALVVALGG